MSPIAGSLPFTPRIFAGDSLIIDVDLPDRMGQSARVSGRRCGQVLDTCAVSGK